MKREVRWAALVVCVVICAGSFAAAQNSGQQNVTVTVLNALPQPAQPVKAVRVSLSYVQSSVLVTDAQEVTNSQGQALLVVSAGVAQRGGLRLQVTGANDLVIYEPADGQISALPATVQVKLLPKGSPALLGPGQIEAMLHRSLLEVSNLQKQNAALKAEVTQAQSQQPDLGAAIAAWAQANGFPSTQADEQVQQWAQKIQSGQAQATAEQKALAEVALKHYASAAQLFNQAADSDASQLDAEEAQEKALMDSLRTHLQQLLNDRLQSASASMLNSQYHQATITLQSATATAQAEYKKHPDDKGFQQLWLYAFAMAASALRGEGEVAPASESRSLLAQSVSDLKTLGEQYASLEDRNNQAWALISLGFSLVDEAERAGGEEAAALLNEAVQADEQALEVYSKVNVPRNWAFTQNGLGLALVLEGANGSRANAAALYERAMQAYRSALEVDTKADLPQDWASTEVNLGNALLDEGILTRGSKGDALLDQAVQAYESALEVYTKTELPQSWAATQNNIGVVLDYKAGRASDDKVAAAIRDQAVEAFERALEVFSKAALPQDWARTEAGLGSTLLHEGMRADGDKAVALFDQAVQTYESTLEIHTRADLPQEWARTQNDLCNALKHEGTLADGDKSAALLDQAEQDCQNALGVFTKAGEPEDWARAEDNLGKVLFDKGELAGGDKAVALFDQAVQAYQQALEVRAKAELPLDWAATLHGLGAALADEGERTSGDKALALFDEAVGAFRHVLEVRTKADEPSEWADTQLNLGYALGNLAEAGSSDKAAALLDEAAQAYRSALEVYTKADHPKEWSEAQEGLAVSDVLQGKNNAAAAEYEQALEAEPNSTDILAHISELDHDRLFLFDKALAVDERRVQLDASTANKMDLLEAELTAAKFEDCIAQAGAIPDSALKPSETVVRDTLGFACGWAAGNKDAARAAEQRVASQAGSLQKGSWGFAGTLHFLADSPAFEKGRASWVALFTAVQDGDAGGVTAALHQLEPLMQN